MVEFVVVFMVEFMVEFVVEFIGLLALAFPLVLPPVVSQAIPIAPKANTAERAKVFFIIFNILLSSSKLIIICQLFFKQSCPRNYFWNIGQYKFLIYVSQLKNG
jgi:hypothetical protein